MGGWWKPHKMAATDTLTLHTSEPALQWRMGGRTQEVSENTNSMCRELLDIYGHTK